MVLTAMGSCLGCAEALGQLEAHSFPGEGRRLVAVVPDHDRLDEAKQAAVKRMGGQVVPVSMGEFTALSSGVAPSVLVSRDHGRDIRLLGPVGKDLTDRVMAELDSLLITAEHTSETTHFKS